MVMFLLLFTAAPLDLSWKWVSMAITTSVIFLNVSDEWSVCLIYLSSACLRSFLAFWWMNSGDGRFLINGSYRKGLKVEPGFPLQASGCVKDGGFAENYSLKGDYGLLSVMCPTGIIVRPGLLPPLPAPHFLSHNLCFS